jgi:transposase InsO family protein
VIALIDQACDAGARLAPAGRALAISAHTLQRWREGGEIKVDGRKQAGARRESLGLETALSGRRPETFNSDQGVQFTSTAFTQRLDDAQVRISMDGRGRVFDNIFVERLWRTLKYEDIYLKDYHSVVELLQGLTAHS